MHRPGHLQTTTLCHTNRAEKSCRRCGRGTVCSECRILAARADLDEPTSSRVVCVKRVPPGPASSQFSKHSRLVAFALSAACGGLRRPAGVGMRSYMRNTDSEGTIVPMILDKIDACRHDNCTVSGSCTSTVILSAVSSRTRKTGSKTLLIQSPSFIPNP